MPRQKRTPAELPVLARALANIRQQNGFASPAALARAAGIAKTTAYRAEKGDTKTTLRTLEGYLAACGRRASEFFAHIERDDDFSREMFVRDPPGVYSTEPAQSSHSRIISEGAPPVFLSDADFLVRIVNACLAAAEASHRHNSRALLEQLAVDFSSAVSRATTTGAGDDGPSHVDQTKQRVRKMRARRASGE